MGKMHTFFFEACTKTLNWEITVRLLSLKTRQQRVASLGHLRAKFGKDRTNGNHFTCVWSHPTFRTFVVLPKTSWRHSKQVLLFFMQQVSYVPIWISNNGVSKALTHYFSRFFNIKSAIHVMLWKHTLCSKVLSDVHKSTMSFRGNG